MTHEEFYQRTNITVPACEFERIHDAYMLTDMNKDAFCDLWKNGLGDYERDCMITAGIQHRKLENSYKAEVKANELRRIEMGKFLADEAHEYSSNRARNKAIEMMGFKAYIAYLFTKGYSLWAIDREQIINQL